MPTFTKGDVQRYRREARPVIAEFTRNPSFNYYVASTNRYAQPLMTGEYYSILEGNRHPELVLVHKGKIIRQPPYPKRLDVPAKLIVVDDVESENLGVLQAAFNRLQEGSGVAQILYFTITRTGELYTRKIPEEVAEAEQQAPLMPPFTFEYVLRFERLSQPVLSEFASDPSFNYYVTSTNRYAQPFMNSAFYTVWARDRWAELVIHHRGRLVRQLPLGLRPDWKAKLVVVDDVQSDKSLECLKRAYPRLKEKAGVQDILYLARTADELFTEFIPPRQTGQSVDSPGAAPQ